MGPLELPPRISLQKAEAVIRKYAPLLCLHISEKHLPSSPEYFREICRFRYSRPGKDFGWSKISRGWAKEDLHGSEYSDVPWEVIIHESDGFLEKYKKRDPNKEKNARPRDSENIEGPFSSHGLFLQRDEEYDDISSGFPCSSSREIQAPVFIDMVRTVLDEDTTVVRVLYWFFYELNHWHFMITHEGDWEHISLLFREESFCEGQEPDFIYFAQHNAGILRNFQDRNRLKRHEYMHPIIYVDKNGHPCTPEVKRPWEYVKGWKTWEQSMIMVTSTDWHGYAGAWGEVGESKHTTGPLGPYFKRNNDNLVVEGKNRRIKASLKR